MSTHLKKMIAETIKQVKTNEKTIEKVKEEANITKLEEKPIVEVIESEEVKEEIKYKSNLGSLMKL